MKNLSLFLSGLIITSIVYILIPFIIKDQLQAIIIELIMTVIIAICFGYFILKFTNGIIGEIAGLKEEKKTIEELTSKLTNQSNNNIKNLAEKVTIIANMLGYTSGYMDTLTNQTENFANEIISAFNQVVLGTNQESNSIEEITNQLNLMTSSIEGVARGAQDQAKSVEYASSTTSLVNQAIEEISNKANIAADASAQASTAAKEGGKTINETIIAINNIRDKVGQSANKVQEMGVRSQEIGIIVEKIKDIAAQTNLLALNAAIEAARAGEMGRGFSVVASEVRKLAENSVIATKEVNDLVLAIQTSAQEAVITMNLGVKEVDNGVEWARQSGTALESIIETTDVAYTGSMAVVGLTKKQIDLSKELGNSMESVSAVVEENAAATEEMAAGSDDISNEMKNISEVSKQNSKAARGVSKLTDEISVLVTDSTASAQTLAEMASSLQNLVAGFNTQNQDLKIQVKPRTSGVKPDIAMILPTTVNLFWKTAIEFAKKGADELGVNLIICDSNGKQELMEQHLLDMVKRKVDGFLWVPYWGLGRKGLTLAREADIPVLFIDSYQGGIQPQSDEFPNYLAFVGPADETGAYEMGKYLLSNLQPSKDGKKYIAALDGPEGAPTAIIRHKGLIRAIKEHPEVVLLNSKKADYEFEKAEICIRELLNEYPQIQGVWAANDVMAQGAIMGAKKLHRNPGKDIFFVGMDLDSESVKAIQNGDQLFDIGGHWLQLGFGLSILYDYLNGYPIPKGRSIVKLTLLPLIQYNLSQFEKEFPNGIPTYDFKQNSRTYNPQAPILFFEMKLSKD